MDINISAWLLLIPLFYTVLSAIILIRRQSEVAEGRKIPFGISTLIWCSIVGGILTLCIPEDDLNGYEGYLASKMYDEAGEKNELSEDEKIELIAKYKKTPRRRGDYPRGFRGQKERFASIKPLLFSSIIDNNFCSL